MWRLKLNTYWYHILSTLNLRVKPQKIQKKYFLSMGPREHPERRGATCSSTGTPKVPFSAKMTKMPLVNLGLTEGQIGWKSSQSNTFHSFSSNPSFSKIFSHFDQIWPSLTQSQPWMDPKILILIWPSNRLKLMSLQRLSNSHSNYYSWVVIGVRTAEMSRKMG